MLFVYRGLLTSSLVCKRCIWPLLQCWNTHRLCGSLESATSVSGRRWRRRGRSPTLPKPSASHRSCNGKKSSLSLFIKADALYSKLLRDAEPFPWLPLVVGAVALLWLFHLTNCKGMKCLYHSTLIDLLSVAPKREIVSGNFCCPLETLQNESISRPVKSRHNYVKVNFSLNRDIRKKTWLLDMTKVFVSPWVHLCLFSSTMGI